MQGFSRSPAFFTLTTGVGMKAIVFALFAVLALAAQACSAAPRFVYSPYKDLAMWRDSVSHVITAAHDGKPQPFIRDGKPAFGPGALTWAFATGECGDETWSGQRAQDVADANVRAFASAGVSYIISTGGQGGVFTCSSEAGMERFVARYASAKLIGFDFDIEATQTPAQVQSLLARIRAAQLHHPTLRFSFTIATLAASDGSLGSLNAQGETILRVIADSRLRDYAINLMTMDFGPATTANCVVRNGACDMGRSAIQAARNVAAKYGVPLSQIELTAMIGVNDVALNVFTLDDARLLAESAQSMGLAGLHFWSLDRDTPCPEPVTGAVATCSTLQQVRSGEFARALGQGVR
jgi:chitinase